MWELRAGADRYQSIHYDMEDLIEQANEIQESLGRSYGIPDELDEADLEAGESYAVYFASSHADNQNWTRSDSTTSLSARTRLPRISRSRLRCPTLLTPRQWRKR